MPYNTDLLAHTQALFQCLPRFDADGSINARTLRLELRARNRFYVFYPQFICARDGGLQYAPQLSPDVRGFIGWLPYFNRRWPAGTGKQAFKDHCRDNGLDLPASWQKPSDIRGDFIVKQEGGSFGSGIRGPFKRYDAADARLQLAAGEYYEEFVPGKIVKAWYLGDKPVCAEARDMPKVVGNGRDSVLSLLLAHPHRYNVQHDWKTEHTESVLRYQDCALDSVPPAGAGVMFEFRYSSLLFPKVLERQWWNGNVLREQIDSPLGRQLVAAGPALARSIPEELRATTVYTVDAILGRDDKLRLLEMNCNPTVHPDVYFPMMETLFGRAKELVRVAPGPAQSVQPGHRIPPGIPVPTIAPPEAAALPVGAGPAFARDNS
jgi:hypothetical protein